MPEVAVDSVTVPFGNIAPLREMLQLRVGNADLLAKRQISRLGPVNFK